MRDGRNFTASTAAATAAVSSSRVLFPRKKLIHFFDKKTVMKTLRGRGSHGGKIALSLSLSVCRVLTYIGPGDLYK